MNLNQRIIYVICMITLWVGCQSNDTPKNTDTIRTGQIKVGSDPTFQPFMELAIDAFQNDCNKKAQIDLEILNEDQAIEKFQKDSLRVIILSRKLTSEEEAPFRNKKLEVNYTTFAYDGIAIIVHPSKPDSIKFERLIELLTGKISKWSQLYSKLTYDNIQVVFDNELSSTVRMMKELVKAPFGKNVNALEENKKVVEYVATHPNAIGIVGLNWVSDGRDPKLGSFMDKINVMGIMPADTSVIPEKKYYKPLQFHLMMQHYPLIRPVYSINAENRQGLGTGFVHYLNSRPGQLVIQTSGLLPGTIAVWKRQVNIKEKIEALEEQQ